MRIGVISDTHLTGDLKNFPQGVFTYFKDVDLILHAGDLVDLAVLQELKKITANVVAVQGNMDSEQTRRELETKQVIEAGKFRIGLIHGYGPPKSLPDLVKQEFQNVHCIVFGHSHQAFSEWREGILFFNPGSPTDKIFAVTNSVGILEINDKITPKIIYL